MAATTDPRDRLEAFVGDWTGHLKIMPSPQFPDGEEGSSRIRHQANLDGLFVVCDYENEGGYCAHGILGFDRHIEQFYFYWFDSTGSAAGGGPALGTWEDDALVLEHKAHVNHDRFTFRFLNPDEYTVDVEGSKDGENWDHILHERFTRDAETGR